MRLWLGYEFTDLMDEYGRYPAHCFNEIRRRLKYAYWSVLINDIRRCRSFFIVGTSEENITSVFSPIWHEWEQPDGTILQGSCNHDQSQEMSQDFDVSKNNNTKNNPTGSNDEALPRDVVVRRRVVADYFKWLVRQDASEQRSLVENLKYRIGHPTDRKGNLIVSQCLKEEQVEQVWDVMVEKVFVPYFSTRDEFFKTTYMHNPEKRIWWLTNLMKMWSRRAIIQARNIWQRNFRKMIAEEAEKTLEAEQMYRPRSPYEWEDADGVRWHITCYGERLQIPPTAPPRPNEEASFNYIDNTWM